MFVLLLTSESSKKNNPLKSFLESRDVGVYTTSQKLDSFRGNIILGDESFPKDVLLAEKLDWIISYNYPHIISPEIIQNYKGKIINLHISLLPWNRGADPNFWSWADSTPKGVTIHHIDEGIDTGEIIVSQAVDEEDMNFRSATLATTYEYLHKEIVKIFKILWVKFMEKGGSLPNLGRISGEGSFHLKKDKRAVDHLFPMGWDTPVLEVRRRMLLQYLKMLEEKLDRDLRHLK